MPTTEEQWVPAGELGKSNCTPGLCRLSFSADPSASISSSSCSLTSEDHPSPGVISSYEKK